MDSWKEMDRISFEISCLEIMYHGLSEETKAIITFPQYAACYPRYLGITRRSCLEAHMVLDMEYREQERLEHGPGGPIFLLLSQLCPVSSTSFHHYRPGLASERTLAP
jgi:hypothetical protein